MEKKNLDWSNLTFSYQKTDKRFVANYTNGAWDEGALIDDDMIVMSEDAGVLQYAQTVFEGLKAYETIDGRIVTFRPDLNADRLHDSAVRLEIPPISKELFLKSVQETVAGNAAWVPPYGSGASLYLRPYIFGINPVIGVKPADEYQFRQGKPLDTIWGYESLGFFTSDDEIANSPAQTSFGEAPRPGDLKYKDQNGDGIIDSKDQIDLGRGGWYGAPLTLGLNFTAKYKGFTLFVLGVGGFGGQGNKVNIGQPSNTNNKGYFAFSGTAKYSVIARDCWTPETAGTALYPRLTSGSGANNFQTSDFWLYKTDRFDIAKIQLTYDCPSSWFESQKIVKGVSVFVNGANLFTFAPEKEILELNVRQAPQSRFFQGGLIVNF